MVEPTRSAREGFPTSATLRLRFADFRLDVHTNSLRLASKLQSYFRDYLCLDGTNAQVQLHAVVGEPRYDASRMAAWGPPRASGRSPKESYYDADGTRLILKNRTGVLIEMTSNSTSITGPLEEHANQVVNVVCTLFGLDVLKRGYAMVHASAVVDLRTGSALLFLGNSGSGKSSVALQLIERGGFGFLSNDRVLLRAHGAGANVVGLPKKPRVNPGTLLASATLSRLVPAARREAYSQLPQDELWRLEEKTDIDVGEEFGARSQLSARLGTVYSLVWRASGDGLAESDLDAASASAALEAVEKDFGPCDPDASVRQTSTEFGRIAALVPFVRVSGRANPRKLAEVVAASVHPTAGRRD